MVETYGYTIKKKYDNGKIVFFGEMNRFSEVSAIANTEKDVVELLTKNLSDFLEEEKELSYENDGTIKI